MSAQDQRGEETPAQVRLAEFRVIGPGAAGQPIPVHFNPESLEYTVTNNIKEQGNSTESKQQVSKSSGKLSMELVFDTTLEGADVREQTEKLQALMKPTEEGDKKIAPVVEFAWGTYRFKGIFTSYKETLDYFSATGVPLRASISITMTQQDGLFDPTAKGEAVDVDDSPAFAPVADEGPATGDPETDRGLAEDNGEDNPRFFSGNELSLPGGPSLQPPAAFASAGLSLGVSAGFGLEAGIGIDVGFSAGVSAGVGVGLGIEAGIDVGLSADFELDIGVDIGFEGRIDVGVGAGIGVGVNVSAQAGAEVGIDIDGGAGASAGIGASSGASAGFGARPSRAGASATAGVGRSGAGALGGSAFAGFVGGEFQHSGPGAAVRSRVRGQGATSLGDDLFDELPLGPRFGGAASAGVPAALGAFAGLRPVGPRRRRPVSLSKLRAQRPERNLRTDTGASFEIGGQAIDRSPGGLGADVGARASLVDRIAFDDALGEG